ncbi:MAG: hypothetical protein V4773_14580 [Verrucomicrobiota bacterium]
MTMHPLYPPPLAGLCTYAESTAPGLSVDATVMRLRRYVYVKSQALFLFAGHFNRLPEWEIKGAISLHLWQDAEHSSWFRQRVTEMRTPPHHLDKVPDPALGAFLQELHTAADSLEFLIGVYEILKPACVAAFREHLAQSHPLTDHPTRRLLQFALSEEEAQIAWGQRAITALLQRDQRRSADATIEAWRTHLRAYLAATNGINGDAPALLAPAAQVPNRALASAPISTAASAATTTVSLPPSRVPHSQPPTQVPQRDARFPHVWRSRGVVPAPDRPVHERLWWMLNVRLQEMHVAELVASVIADWRDQPWEFYHDLARHLWDETRHCMLGEVSFAAQGIDFTQIPTHVGFAEYPNTQLPAPDRYTFLWGIEQGLMTKSGKQAEVALAKAGQNELATVFQDFDWADEVLHAQIGRRWLEPYFGTREALNAVYQRVRPDYEAMRDTDAALPGRDWFPSFYQKHLKHLDPHLGQPVAQTAPPPVASGY